MAGSLAEKVESQPNPYGSDSSGLYQELLPLAGLDCADCALTLENAVGRLDGVRSVSVNYPASNMHVEYDPTHVVRADILGRVRELGYDVAESKTPQGAADERKRFGAGLHMRRRDLAMVASGVCLALAVALGLAGAPQAVQRVWYAAAMLVGGFYIARSGLAALRTSHTMDINFLMTVAALGAAALGEWVEGATVVFLFSLGETLDGLTLNRARNAIRSLMSLAPAEATVLRPCMECPEHGYSGQPCPICPSHAERVPVEALQVGDLVLVKPGERIPVDGAVLAGSSAVNQAPITGESIPVVKAPGDEVFAGTINGSGALDVRVTRLASDNTLSRIIHLVEQAQTQKATSQRFVDTFARYYTPAVVAGAVLVAVVPPLILGQPFLGPAGWLYRALVLLVIACPCALVISTPVSIVSAISTAARNGVLIKGGAFLEAAGRLRAIAFDKTGTLTLGQPAVIDTECVECMQPGDVCDACADMLALAAAVERRSEHPLAQAVVRAAEARGVAGTYSAESVEALAGRGVRGQVNGQTVTVGSHPYFDAEVPHSPDLCQLATSVEANGQTAMLIGDENGARGIIAVADEVRASSRAVIAALKRSGIEHTIMLTGDNEATARTIAAAVGVDEVQARLLPEQKVQAVDDLVMRYGSVGMIGDGVNDAPALARATVGIALGGAGTDQALETADIVLMADDLSKLPFTIDLSRRTRRVIQQNVAFSLALKALFLALALSGAATLWMAVIADVGASLAVILNGMRLLHGKRM